MAVLQTQVLNQAIAEYAFAITKSDTVDISADAGNIKQKEKVRVYVGGAGDLKVNTSDGQTVTFSTVPAGTLLPIFVSRVWSAGTTATLLIAMA